MEGQHLPEENSTSVLPNLSERERLMDLQAGAGSMLDVDRDSEDAAL